MLPNIVLVYKLIIEEREGENANIFLDKYKRLEQIILHTETQNSHTHVRVQINGKVSTRIFCRPTGFCHPP